MKNHLIYIIKPIGMFLLILFTLQVTDLTCIGEDISFDVSKIQAEYQLKAADTDYGVVKNYPAGHICQCPCHLSFLQFSSSEIPSYLQAGLPAILVSQASIKKISTDIFQPPKSLI